MFETRLRKSKTISSSDVKEIVDLAGEKVISLAKKQILTATGSLEACSDDLSDIKNLSQDIIRIQTESCDYFAVIADECDYKITKFSITELLETVSNALSKFIRDKDISFTISDAKDKLFVVADWYKTYYSVLNIVRNSIEWSENESRMRVAISEGKKYVKVKISDKGKGMDEETLKNCCNPFFTRDNGLGLGLTLSKRHIENMGGTLEINSESGKGTSVYVSLPKFVLSPEETVKVNELEIDMNVVDYMTQMILSGM